MELDPELGLGALMGRYSVNAVFTIVSYFPILNDLPALFEALILIVAPISEASDMWLVL